MAVTRQDSGNEFLSSRGQGTTMKKSATQVAAIGLLLLVTTVGAMSQTLSTPGSDQFGGVPTSPSVKAGMPVGAEADSVNTDPTGRYDWKTSYDFQSALPSHDSGVQGNLTAEARLLEMEPIDTPTLPYLTIASKGAEREFSSTYGGSYEWSDLYEFNAKVAYAKSKIPAVRDSGEAVEPPAETPSAEAIYYKAVTDGTGLSNK